MTVEQKEEAKRARLRAEESSKEIELEKTRSLTTEGFSGGGSPDGEPVQTDPALARMENETSSMVNNAR